MSRDRRLADRFADVPAVAAEQFTELGRRNHSALAMDLLFLFTTAFFAHHLVRGFWPAVIAAVPLIGLLYFGWRSSKPFFIAQAITAWLTIEASLLGLVPL